MICPLSIVGIFPSVIDCAIEVISVPKSISILLLYVSALANEAEDIFISSNISSRPEFCSGVFSYNVVSLSA